MARPITWRTIAGPSFNNSALGQGIDAFRSAGAGFSDLTDSLFRTQDRIDKGFTNDSIRQSLETDQIDPNMNPRADSAAVYEALLGKRKFESDLETAGVNRESLRADTKHTLETTKKLAFENTPEWRGMLKDEKLAQIERWKAEAKNAQERNRLEALRIDLLKEEKDRANELRTNLRGAEARFAEDVAAATKPLVEEQTGQAQQSIGGQIAAEVQRMLDAGEDPAVINSAVRRMSSEASTKFAGIDDLSRSLAREQVLSNYANNPGIAAELGLLPTEFQQTTPGSELQLAKESAAAVESARQIRAAELDKYQLGVLSNAANSADTHGIIVDPASPDKFRVAADAGEAKGNKLTIGQWNAAIERAGLTKELEDVAKNVFEETRGNKSILDTLLQLPGLSDEGFVEQARVLQDGLQNFAADARVAALRQEDPYTLTGVQARLANETADSRFLGEPPASPSAIKSTDDPQLKSQAATALEEIQRLRQARPDMPARQAELLDKFEQMFLNGTVDATYQGVSRRRRTKILNDSDIREKLENWNQYQQRNGYK